ncbi:MAG: YcaQ family DNA glycosylase [Bdellovibrionales bacterium]|nr:YcaQ family DNA glycosylase [Bdellovibrionales bacterium]
MKVLLPAPAPVRLSAAEARRLAAAPLREAPNAAEALARMGTVQIDTISVVERAHHHILWTRVPGYRAGGLETLQHPERRALEYWSHAAAYLPMADYRHCLPRMKHYRDTRAEAFASQKKLMVQIRRRIRAEGPLRSSDFEAPEGHRAGGWWEWKPAKAALERMFHAGELLISRREGFQKRFDLAERVLDSGVDSRTPTALEHGRYLALQAVDAAGLASFSEMTHLRAHARDAVRAGLAALLEEGALTPVAMEGLKGLRYARPAGIELAASAAPGRPAAARVRILSPFDPVVILRRRLKEVFGFDYTLECYVPGPKRKYGYFSLPLLWESEDGSAAVSATGTPTPAFLGRLDAKAHRDDGVLRVECLHLEPAFGAGGRARSVSGATAAVRAKALPVKINAALERELQAFAAFNGCRLS